MGGARGSLEASETEPEESGWRSVLNSSAPSAVAVSSESGMNLRFVVFVWFGVWRLEFGAGSLGSGGWGLRMRV